jgi:hypothetical protein
MRPPPPPRRPPFLYRLSVHLAARTPPLAARFDKKLAREPHGAAAITLRGGLRLLAVLGATACVDLGGNNPTVTIWETQLAPGVAYPDVSGQAAAVSDPGGTSVGIGIHGATPGAEHTWGLRLGRCVAPGEQIGADALYPTLAVSDSGTASAQTHVDVKLAANGVYHVAVRLSATDASRVACGDMVPR